MSLVPTTFTPLVSASSLSAANPVWEHLFFQYQARIQACIPEAAFDPVPVERLTQNFEEASSPSESRDFLQEALERVRSRYGEGAENATVFEVRWPKAGYLPLDVINIPSLFAEMQRHLGGRFVLSAKEGSDYRLRVVPPTLLEAGFRLLYGDDLGWIPVPGIIPRDDINEAHDVRKAPLGLSLNPLMLDDFGQEVEGFVFAVHDLFHGVRMMVMDPRLRGMAVSLYRTIRRLPEQDQVPEFSQDILDILADLVKFRTNSVPDFLKEGFFPIENEVRGLHYRHGVQLYRDASELAPYHRFLDLTWREWESSVPDLFTRSAGLYLKNLLNFVPERPSFP